MDFLDNIIALIDSAIDVNAENSVTQWNIIAKWYNKDIDADRNMVEESHEWILNYKTELIELSGISSLKIKYTNNSGYFIEVPSSQVEKVPKDLIQKQTLTQVVRYTTVILQNFEQDLLNISSTLFQKEYECFLWIRNTILCHFNDIYKLSRNISQLDFYLSGAKLVANEKYILPTIDSNYKLEIKWWKHPVIAQQSKDFISNDLGLEKNDFIHVITGPNMWWKSTFLRQNALIIILSHIGYPVPASHAKIPIIDKVFSRVGAWDNLFLWQSTFMVEMQEIAYILHNSTKNSFVIIDEIWRWTSTYDGMSLAWSILQYNHNTIKAKTLFATHYHEIIDHTEDLKWASNYSMAIGENDDNIVFLRKIIPGWIKKSYGIEVAKLAGIPPEVLKLAKTAMLDFKNETKFKQLSFINTKETPSQKANNWVDNQVLDMIKNLDINSFSPLEALLKLEELQKQVKK